MVKKNKLGGYKPKFQSDLDLINLSEFIEKHSGIRNNTEYLVVFIVFLTEELQLEVVSGDDLFTCFVTMKAKLKVPKNFVSAFKNAQNKEHVVQYDSGYTNFSLPAAGSNLYHHEILKRVQT